MHATSLTRLIHFYLIVRIIFSEKFTLWSASCGEDADYCFTALYSQDSELDTDQHENRKSFLRTYRILLQNIHLIKGKVIPVLNYVIKHYAMKAY
jgi:hypothetical protein